MKPSSELRGMFRTLEERPSDFFTMFAMADWFEDQGSFSSAECLRWLACNKKFPFRYSSRNKRLIHHHESWHQGWFWWTTTRQRLRWGYDTSSTLPHRIWKRMSHSFPYDPVVFKEYPTVETAISVMIESWIGPRPRNRQPSKRTPSLAQRSTLPSAKIVETSPSVTMDSGDRHRIEQ